MSSTRYHRFMFHGPADFISTFFHEDRIWPMKDEASPLDGWDYHEYIRFAPKATNDVIGSLFFFLRDMLLRFCRRIRDVDIHFQLFNVDARVLPDYLNTQESQFDRIEVGISFLSTLRAQLTQYGFQTSVIADTSDPKRPFPHSARSSNPSPSTQRQHC